MFNVAVHIIVRWNNAPKYTQSYNRNITKSNIEISKIVSFPCTGNSQREILGVNEYMYIFTMRRYLNVNLRRNLN